MFGLIVHLKVKPEDVEEALRLMRLLEEGTRGEPGCIYYIGHQSVDDPSVLAFYEQYRSRADLDAHGKTGHYQKYAANGLDKLAVERTLHFFNTVS